MTALEHERLDGYQASSQSGRGLLRVVAMLTAMLVKIAGSGSS